MCTGIEALHIWELEDDDPPRPPVRAFRKFMAADLGDVAATIAGNRRWSLDPILLELDGIGDDVFADIIDGHWLLRSGCCIDTCAVALVHVEDRNRGASGRDDLQNVSIIY